MSLSLLKNENAMRCNTCRKDKAETDSFLTLWGRIKLFLFNKFHEEITDLSAEKFTSGFGEGYAVGFGHAKEFASAHTCPVYEPPTQPIPLGCQVDLHRVFEVTKDGKMFLGSRQLDAKEIEEYQSQANVLSQLPLWGLMQETLKQKAIEGGILRSEKWEDTLSSKAMLHNLGIQRSIVTVLQNYKSQ